MIRSEYNKFLKPLNDDFSNTFIQIYKNRKWKYSSWRDEMVWKNVITPNTYFVESEFNEIIDSSKFNDRLNILVKLLKEDLYK